jgi:hypothetical protein
MKNQFEINITKDGKLETIYQDGLPQKLNAAVEKVERASSVEYENIEGRIGWTVRSAKDPELALRATDWCRCGPARTGAVLTFQTREEALEEEVKHFWGLFGKEDL